MKRIQITDNFYLDEFIHPTHWNKYKSASIWFLDQRILTIAQTLRTDLGKPITINNWAHGGQYKLSGLRPLNTTIGAKMSQHKFGRAIDVKVKDLTPPEIVQFIKDNESKYMGIGLTTIEKTAFTPTWTHLDCRLTGKTDLFFVNG